MACLRCDLEIDPESPSLLADGWRCVEKYNQCLRVNPDAWREVLMKYVCRIFGHLKTDVIVCVRCRRARPTWRQEYARRNRL